MSPAHTHSRLRRLIPAALLAGDTLVIFGALLAGYWLRYHTPLGDLFIEVSGARLGDYLPLLGLGCGFLVISFAHNRLYDERLLLRLYQSLSIILKGIAFWFVTYLGMSLVLKFSPPISRLFVVYACLCTVVLLWVWRSLAHRLLVGVPALTLPLRQRAAILGWSDEAADLCAELGRHESHPYLLIGLIERPEGDVPVAPPPGAPARLGTLAEIENLFVRERIDVLITARLDLPREELSRLVNSCEKAGVELKIIPSVFQVFVTGLRLQTIGAVPVLGVEELALGRFLNRALKRCCDVAGAALALPLSLPLMVVLAVLIRRESPGAPVLFRQSRVGAGGRDFVMLKLRSMTPGAEARDHERQSTPAGDSRLLRIGAWMRRWNLDELPQLWNVLRGDMSLVGPRPERRHHAETLSSSIPHYMPRHLVKPGMTGWAQVNGLRGNCSIERRIQHDLFYIENWSPWLDLQIVLLTLVRWKNPSE